MTTVVDAAACLAAGPASVTTATCMEAFTLHFSKDKFADGVLVHFVVSFSIPNHA